jgi:multisubunit Na+/H+ antiporter MnhF subunit
MHELVFQLAAVWVAGLLGATVAAVLRGRSRLDQILAADAMVLLVIAMALLVTGGLGEPEFVDAALALGLLGFSTTVALVRLVSRGDDR